MALSAIYARVSVPMYAPVLGKLGIEPHKESVNSGKWWVGSKVGPKRRRMGAS